MAADEAMCKKSYNIVFMSKLGYRGKFPDTYYPERTASAFHFVVVIVQICNFICNFYVILKLQVL